MRISCWKLHGLKAVNPMKNRNVSERLPRVSLIVVTMNRKEILKRCLESFSLQTNRDYEVIVVDNASSDGTGDLIRQAFPHVRYFFLNTNSGPPGGRNHGVRMARGEFCVFIDDDAVFAENNALDQVVSYFRQDNGLGCIAFRIVQPGDGLEEYKSIPRADKKRIAADYECSYFCGAGFAVRRSIFLEMGMFWEPLIFIGEELDFSYRLVNEGYKIMHSSAISVIHYETQQARVPGKWIYYGVRSRCWVAIRNLPWINVLSHTLLWWGYFFVAGIRNRHIIYFLRGIKDTIIGLPKAMKTRSCITQETIGKLKTLSGRIYY